LEGILRGLTVIDEKIELGGFTRSVRHTPDRRENGYLLARLDIGFLQACIDGAIGAMLNDDDFALEGEGSDGRYFPAEDDPHLCPRGYSYVDPLVGDGAAALVFYGAEGAGDDGFIGFYGPWQKALILLKGPGDAYFGSSQVAFALSFQL